MFSPVRNSFFQLSRHHMNAAIINALQFLTNLYRIQAKFLKLHMMYSRQIKIGQKLDYDNFWTIMSKSKNGPKKLCQPLCSPTRYFKSAFETILMVIFSLCCSGALKRSRRWVRVTVSERRAAALKLVQHYCFLSGERLRGAFPFEYGPGEP